MNKNVKVVYQAYEEGILALVYEGNEVLQSWEFEWLPDAVQVHFKLDVPKYD